MAIKTVIQGLISSLIRTNPSLIDKTEHADVEDALLDSLYGTVISESNLTVNTITEKNLTHSGLTYDINILKQGRKVSISGKIKNTTINIVAPLDGYYFFKIVDSEFLPNPTTTTAKYSAVDIDYLEFGGVDKTEFYSGAIGAGQTVTFNIEYFTKD